MCRSAMSWLAAAAAVFSLVGCNSQGRSGQVAPGSSQQVGPIPELLPMTRPPIADVPVPIGFHLDEGKSRNFAAAGARYIDHVYTGRADKFAVGRFYKRQMPINRWTLVTDMFVQGNIMLDFEKSTERCRITITEGGLFRGTVVKIAVWTSGRITQPAGGSRRG
ncbi:MAG: hypothetical protein J7M21_01015 [Planctomycetes bacterium]|nr:hypothetical protein [Planctomycetota bacterium]